MKKVYQVTYKSADGKNLDKIKEQISLLGQMEVWINTRMVFSAFVLPSDEKIDARAIRNKLRVCIDPFYEGVAAIEVNELDMADTDGCRCLPKKYDQEKIRISEEDGKRNFNRFKTRHEAFVAYELERPMWIYPDNLGNAILMDIYEWLWMPIKKDGQYERGKYEKYLK